MDRIEFLNTLESELSGKISAAQIRQNLNYYSSYIQEQKKLGYTETEIMEQLGDPRLIARTIVEAFEAAGGSAYDTANAYDGGEDETSFVPRRDKIFYVNGRMINFEKWYVKLLAGIVTVLVGILFLGIVVLIVRVALWLAVPILVIAAILYLLQHFFYR